MDSPAIKIVLITVGIILIGAMLSWRYVYRSSSAQSKVMGVLYTPKQAYHCTVIEEIKKLASASTKPVVIKEFAPATNADPVLVQAAASAALDDASVVLIVSVGAICSQTLANMSKRRGLQKPIVFIGADNPVQLGLVDSMNGSAGYVTGVIGQSNEILNSGELLCIAKPQARRVLLPFYARDATDMIEQQAGITRDYCRSQGVDVSVLPVDNVHNALVMIAHKLKSYDTLMYLEGDVLCSLAPSFAKICTAHNVTLFAGSIDVADNAAFCYAIEPKIEAQVAFEIIKKILFDGVAPCDIPVAQPRDCRDFVINVATCQKQGVADVDPAEIIRKIRSNPALSLIHNRIVVK